VFKVFRGNTKFSASKTTPFQHSRYIGKNATSDGKCPETCRLEEGELPYAHGQFVVTPFARIEVVPRGKTSPAKRGMIILAIHVTEFNAIKKFLRRAMTLYASLKTWHQSMASENGLH
jgi:hypothetical protein